MAVPSLSSSVPAAGRWRPTSGVVVRVGRRTLVESLYLLTAPFSAVFGLYAAVRGVRGRRSGAWLSLGHAVMALPVVFVTSALTAFWWFIALATLSFPVRVRNTPATLRPMTLYAGSGKSHIWLSLGLTTPGGRLAFALTVGVVTLLTLPVLTRVCVAVQIGLGEALLSDVSALHRRIRGLERERDTARAQAVAAVTAEAEALRRLERDIHDGPQQRLVRLALELGRAQHHLDRKPDLARQALGDALVQAQETLDELRALSRGIAPPILADRGLREALAAMVASSVVPAEFDTDVAAGSARPRLDAAVETAAYFVVAEALTNVAKHSGATSCVVGMRHEEGSRVRVWVTDDGVGGAAFAKGHGLRGLGDRVGAVGGRLDVVSPAGGPTTISAELPCR
ncbi:signal transduction histidine kinase [Catenulispora sp. GAS73]|uniref:sensor histidine kinase n=1 Tax=Catenulispora sp. GAS73 TaxID=3156269 RepID=UPI003510DF35